MSTAQQQVQLGRKRHGVRALITLAAALAAILVYTIVVLVLGIEVRVPESFGSRTLIPLTFDSVVGAAIIAAVAGWALLTVLELVTKKARLIWTVVAVVVFLFTLPYMPGFRIVDRVVLVLLHTALAAVLIIGMRRTTAPAA